MYLSFHLYSRFTYIPLTTLNVYGLDFNDDKMSGLLRSICIVWYNGEEPCNFPILETSGDWYGIEVGAMGRSFFINVSLGLDAIFISLFNNDIFPGTIRPAIVDDLMSLFLWAYSASYGRTCLCPSPAEAIPL